MINLEMSKSITEVLDIVEHMDDCFINKIPQKFITFLKSNKVKNYYPAFDHSKKIGQMQLSKNTKNLLAIIYYKYWCNQEEKKEFIKKIKQNEMLFQKQLREKYNPDNIFKSNKKKKMCIS